MKQLLKTIIFLLIINQLGAQQFYVSKTGHNSNLGTAQKPVATLQKAQALVRDFKKANPGYTGEIVVTVMPGTYELTSTLSFNEQDAGNVKVNVRWQAFAKNKVTLSGGKNINGRLFKKVTNPSILARLEKNAAENIVEVSLTKLGITNFGTHQSYGHGQPVIPAPLELYYNQDPLLLAHYPNNGAIKIGKVLDKGSVPRIGDKSNRGGLFNYTDNRQSKWIGQKDIWIQGTFNYGFADDYINIANIDTAKKEIKLASPHIYGIANGRDFQEYIAYNILEELDSPGEWWLDKKTGMLYVWPPVNRPANSDGKTDIATANITVSILETPIVSIINAEHLTIEGFTIEAGRDMGVYLEGGNNNTIAGCTVRNLGTSGIFMGQGAEAKQKDMSIDDFDGTPTSGIIGSLQNYLYKNTSWSRNAGFNQTIISCDVYNTGSGGIYLSGGDKRTLTKANNIVENCKVHDFNRRNKFIWSGISVDGCGNKIRHCEIYNSDWQGIFVHGNEHIFEYNNIHHVTLNSDDTSPWYIGRDPSDRGNVVRYNYFHHIGNPNRMNMGIYCDDSSADVFVFGNVFYKMETKHGILFTNSGWDLVMKNNIIIEPTDATAQISAHYYTWAAGSEKSMFGENGLIRNRLTKSVAYQQEPYASKYPGLLEYLDTIPGTNQWKGMRAHGNVFADNLIIGGPKSPTKLIGGNYATITERDNYRSVSDPGFVDMAHENFTLRPTSEVFKKIKGFEPVPFEKMGLYKDKYRN
ncbi:MAG: right-handed parallel beta-helix repeat-containing protein [Bacteroidota bacterium]|jgi:parallel beta-helix repeat protein